MTLPKKVRIREVGPREGFQSLHGIVTTSDKIKLINALSETGVKDIEAVSMVRGDRVPQMADAEEVSNGLVFQNGVRYSALYLNKKGFERAQNLRGFSNEAWLLTSGSEEFLKANSNQTWQEMTDSIPGWVKLFRDHGKKVQGILISTAFGHGSGRLSSAALCGVVQTVWDKVKEAGETISEVALADTIGIANPSDVKRAINAVRERFHGVEISLHLHDTRGSGLANAYAGLEEHITIFDSSVGGIGGCPFTKGGAGNICTEDFIHLCHSMGIDTGISLQKYCEAAKLAASIVGQDLPGKMYKLSEF